MDLSSVTSAEINQRLKELRSKENEAIADIVLHLSELDRRGDYRELGYSSLFVYCTGYLGYSEGAACRRIAAARSITEHPEILEKLRVGALSLCAVLELSKVVTEENKRALIAAAEGKSKREVQRLVSRELPPVEPKRERVVAKRVVVAESPLFESKTVSELPPPVTEERWSLSLEADKEFMELYASVKNQVGVVRMVDVLKVALKHYVKSNSPAERERRRVERTVRKAGGKKVSQDVQVRVEMALRNASSKKVSRHIPANVRDRIYLRDEGRCTFCGPNGNRCEETKHLQVDHVRPWAKGGDHDPDNLRLLCASHNRLMAERAFGKANQSCQGSVMTSNPGLFDILSSRPELGIYTRSSLKSAGDLPLSQQRLCWWR